MDFSELLKFSGQLAYSPDGKHLATTDKYRLFVRNSESLEIEHIFTCLDVINRIEWSSDSQYLLCAQYKRRIVQVWSIEQPKWTCKIDEGLSGLLFAQWSPDGRHILVTAEFQLRLTIWSLVNKTAYYIKMPKNGEKAIDFSRDGKYMAVVERREFRDVIGLYYTETWELIKHFEVDSEDLAAVKFSPDGRAIAVIDTCLEYRVLVYSLDGRKLCQYEAYENALGVKAHSWSSGGQFLAVGSFDQMTRVLNNLTWAVVAEFNHKSPISHQAVLVYTEAPLDDAVKIAPSLSEEKDDESELETGDEAESAPARDKDRSVMADPLLESEDDKENKDAQFRRKLQEIQMRTKAAAAAGSLPLNSSIGSLSRKASQRGLGGQGLSRVSSLASSTSRESVLSRSQSQDGVPIQTKYVISQQPCEIPQLRPDPDKPNPKLGVGMVAWSYNDRFLFTRNDNMPCTLWIWDAQKLSLTCVLNQLSPIRVARWDPTSERIAICTDNGKLYVWSPQGCFIVDVPAAHFAVKNLRWNEDGRSLVLADAERFCCCYFQPPPEELEEPEDGVEA